MSQQINLFNPLFLRKEKYFSTRTMLQSLGLIALGLVVIYAYGVWQLRSQELLAEDYGKQLSAQRDQFIAVSGRGPSKLLEAEVARLEGDLRTRRGVLELMESGGGLGNTEGFARYFAAFARHPVRGVWLTGFSVGDNGNALNVRGRVLHPDLLPVYLKALNEEGVMRGRLVTELKLAAKEAVGARRGTGAGASAGPERFVEFDFSAPLHLAQTGQAAATGARP